MSDTLTSVKESVIVSHIPLHEMLSHTVRSFVYSEFFNSIKWLGPIIEYKRQTCT